MPFFEARARRIWPVDFSAEQNLNGRKSTRPKSARSGKACLSYVRSSRRVKITHAPTNAPSPLQGASRYVFVTEVGTPVTTAWFLWMVQRIRQTGEAALPCASAHAQTFNRIQTRERWSTSAIAICNRPRGKGGCEVLARLISDALVVASICPPLDTFEAQPTSNRVGGTFMLNQPRNPRGFGVDDKPRCRNCGELTFLTRRAPAAETLSNTSDRHSPVRHASKSLSA